MQVYIAGQYARKLEFREYAAQCRQQGITVGARWLDESEAPTIGLNDNSDEKLAHYGQRDYQDIQDCDIFVFFAEPNTNQPPRGGRHVEFGMAVQLRRPIVVIGQPENIFHYLPWLDVEFFDNWNSALAYLVQKEIGD